MKIEVEDIMDNITEIIDKMYKEMHMISVFQGTEYSQICIILIHPSVESRSRYTKSFCYFFNSKS